VVVVQRTFFVVAGGVDLSASLISQRSDLEGVGSAQNMRIAELERQLAVARTHELGMNATVSALRTKVAELSITHASAQSTALHGDVFF
jgi:hypothetical protein